MKEKVKNFALVVLFIFMAIVAQSLEADAQEPDTRTIPDLVAITGTATYGQFFAVQDCLIKGVAADSSGRDERTGAYILFFFKHNVKVIKRSSSRSSFLTLAASLEPATKSKAQQLQEKKQDDERRDKAFTSGMSKGPQQAPFNGRPGM